MFVKLKCGKLYDGVKRELQEGMEILIEGKHIKEVGHNLPCPEGTVIKDLTSMSVTPGMIDGHIHPQFFDYRELYTEYADCSDGYRTLAVASNAQKTLRGGFTTIRIPGWFSEAYEVDVKRAIEDGKIEGSRIIAGSHYFCTPGSSGDASQSMAKSPYMGDFMQKCCPTCGTGADFFTNAVRREKKVGYDFIKIFGQGAFATPNDDPQDIQLNDDEFRAIFSTAKDLRMPVAAHVYAPGMMQKLLGYNIFCMEHGALMDDTTARMIEDKGVYLVCTFLPYEDIVHPNPETLAKKSDFFRRKLQKYQDWLQRSREIIINSKIKLGYGTDIVDVYKNYECGLEFKFWMKNGMDPFRALEAATRTNSEICCISDVTGTIEPGKFADIAGWKRDLLKDSDALRDCSFVMKEGVEYQAESRMYEQNTQL